MCHICYRRHQLSCLIHHGQGDQPLAHLRHTVLTAIYLEGLVESSPCDNSQVVLIYQHLVTGIV